MSSFVIGRTTANSTGVSNDCATFIVFFNEINSSFLSFRLDFLVSGFKIVALSAKELQKISGVGEAGGVTSPWG